MTDFVSFIFEMSAPCKITKSIIVLLTIQVATFKFGRFRRYEGLKY